MLRLGQLDLTAGDSTAAAELASQVLAASPDAEQQIAARCLRGRALAAASSCAAAVAELDACPASRTDADVALALLDCHARLGQWRQAQAFAAELPPPLRARRDIGRLVRRTDRQVAKLPTPEEEAARAAREAAAAAAAAQNAPPEKAAEQSAGDPVPAAPPRAPVPATAPPVAAAPELATADREKLERARQLLARARRSGDLAEPYELASGVADANPGIVEAQNLAAEIAYRASRWSDAVRYFHRGEPSGRPELLFYLAVALYESGDREESARILKRALPDLPSTPFVQSYAEKILGSAG